MKNILTLKQYLLHIRPAYLNQDTISNTTRDSVDGGTGKMIPKASIEDVRRMNDQQKNGLDAQVQAFIKGYLAMIKSLERLASNSIQSTI